MVCYCCVQGCGNNSNNKKKDPNSLISFHAFPSNQEQKTKWLKAIGRPNWTPASHARICSAHFKYDQINYDGCRIRIKDDAVPVNLLPPNSNFEASNVEACRICLATDIKMYSLKGSPLGTCMETIAGVHDEDTNHIDSRSYTILGPNCKVETDGEEFCENFDLEDDGTSLVQSIGSSKANMGEDKKIKSQKYTKKEVTTPKKSKGLTPDESSMLKYFDIVQLSGLGQYECPVCKLRFKSATLAAAHRKRAHSKKFFCKTCPKSFNNVNVAKKHSRWHSGYEYRCPRCAFASVHESALCAHRRRVHGPAHGCVHCGRHYSTARGLSAHKHAAHAQADCNINFASEGARRVHLLTSSQHKNKSSLCDSTTDPVLRNCCNKCGVECNSFKELLVHMRASHPRSRRSDQPWKGDTPYPLDCELCGERISCRKKHWFHVRRRHPMHVDSYQPIITVICDTCGKGFQVHTDVAPYECTICNKKFKYSSSVNLHVRTVHYKLPHPTRKKRSKSGKDIGDS
ncbi:hypothetical protein HF086_011541 [Spodoptera exigua]|uniref:Uncharacterized protein n=1 Tax=Spodoptera exigua TaxID=7107 RepID=A0A922MD00_SPOEX|nr:hypothetical protein HF086_011541 [Spodoptera exigua]